MTPKLGVAGILRRPDGRVLFIERGNPPQAGRWAFPGGSVEFQETLQQAVIREFFEETGLVVTPVALIHVAEILDGDRVHFVVLDYVVEASQFVAHPGSDARRIQWVADGEWQSLPLAEGMRACLEAPGVRNAIGWTGS